MTMNLCELQQELRKVFSQEGIDVEFLKKLLTSYKSNPKDWKQYACFSDTRYTRHLVDTGNDKYNLLILCWNMSQGSSIHDHSNADCFVKILDGDLKETRFDWPTGSSGGNMNKISEQVYHKDEVTHITDAMGLHRMENPSHTEGTVTLHLYTPPFRTCQTFDEASGHKGVAKMVFDTEYGKPADSCQAPRAPENN